MNLKRCVLVSSKSKFILEFWSVEVSFSINENQMNNFVLVYLFKSVQRESPKTKFIRSSLGTLGPWGFFGIKRPRIRNHDASPSATFSMARSNTLLNVFLLVVLATTIQAFLLDDQGSNLRNEKRAKLHPDFVTRTYGTPLYRSVPKSR